jgi:hypothetical protein
MTEAELNAIRVYNTDGTPSAYVDPPVAARLLLEVRRLRAALVKAHNYGGCLDEPGKGIDCGICEALR